jgi:SPW repeat-containing protein
MTRYIPWLVELVAIWLIAAPFVLGYANTDVAMRNDVGVGLVLFIGALAWWLSDSRAHGVGSRMGTQGR